MKKIILPILIITAMSANAKELSVAEAEAAARNLLSAQPSHNRAAAKAEWSLAAQGKAYFAFNTGAEGFVVASADSDFPAVLGFSDSGSIDTSNMPPALKYMLEEYAAQMQWAKENHVSLASAAASTQLPNIAPLMTTTWDQNSPYNRFCPALSGTTNCATGCVATAMAQVMRYHKWPEKGTGSHSYQTKINDTGSLVTISSDFSAHTYDWKNMANQLTGASSENQKAAVAQLMFDCGVAVNMEYGNISYSSSNAVPVALKTYFGYDEKTNIYMRNVYEESEWIEMLHASMSECGPIIYSGSSETGGAHEFVLDGVKDDKYFHVNWGWSGLSDGYFLLTALAPSAQGTGGLSKNYNYNQNAILYIRPQSEKPESKLTVTDLTLLETPWIQKKEAHVKFTITNHATTNFNGEITLNLQHCSVSAIHNKYNLPLELSAGESTTIQLSYDIPNASALGQYDYWVSENINGVDVELCDRQQVTIVKDSGVEELFADPDTNITVTNLLGIIVYQGPASSCTLPKGAYVVNGEKIMIK